MQLEEKVRDLFLKNRREIDGHRYTVPSPKSYPHQWLWDSCFHAIILSHFDNESAKRELGSLVVRQFESGLIPHIIYWEDTIDTLRFNWGVLGSSAITQPPLIAYSALRVYEKDNDIGFLKFIFPHLNRYYRYLLTRDPRTHHLVGLINPDESGEDNSPRFDMPLGLPPKHSVKENNDRRFALFDQNTTCNFDAPNCMKNFFWVKDVPFNTYMVENLHAMHDIAIAICEREEADFYLHEANLIRDAMRKLLHEDGVYWSIYGNDHTKIKVKTWAIFAPLLIDTYSKEEAHALVQNYLLNPGEFGSPYGIPTTSFSEEAFSPDEPKDGPPELHPNWRGPVWMAPNWFAYRGLKRYGFDAEAAMIAKQSRELVERSGFREYYHPKTGEGLGAHNFTWGGLILDMKDDA